MSEDITPLSTMRWNEAYRRGKYASEGPLPMVNLIVELLGSCHLQDTKGLYVGCGNGRNYIPLIDTGLDLEGLDISPLAIRQIILKRPDAASHLQCAAFLDYVPDSPYDYLIALQVFQHGNMEQVHAMFEKSKQIIRPGGLLFVRVNSVSTDIFHDHKILELTSDGGKTICYTSGPKAGMVIHFYSKLELNELTRAAFEVISPLTEVSTERQSPQKGRWVQWEGVWRRL